MPFPKLQEKGRGYNPTAEGIGFDNQIVNPDLVNRILRIPDGAGTPNQLDVYQCWIPFFMSEGFSQQNLNNILCGGFWIDKFAACQPDASNVSIGSFTPNAPGAGVGASCKPHVVPWVSIDLAHAKAAIEARNGSANVKTGTCVVVAGEESNAFLVAAVTDLVGQSLEIIVDGVTYYRRIIQTGKLTEPKYVKFYPDLPSGVTIDADDTYSIIGHHLLTPHEVFSLQAWAMKYRYRYGLGYPKGNNDYGKDIGDPRARQFEGVSGGLAGDATHNITRVLTGSGPLSWSLNGKESGVWDLNGNIYEMINQTMTADGTAIVISSGYPGQGVSVKPTTGTTGQGASKMYDGDVPTGGYSLNSYVDFATELVSGGISEFGNDGANFLATAATYAVNFGSAYSLGLYSGIFQKTYTSTISTTLSNVGFRGAF